MIICNIRNIYWRFTILAKSWKQPRYPSVDDVVLVCNGNYSVTKINEKKKNELLSHEKIWRNLKCILLSERSQSEKATYYMIPIYIDNILAKAKTTEIVLGWPKSSFRFFHKMME